MLEDDALLAPRCSPDEANLAFLRTGLVDETLVQLLDALVLSGAEVRRMENNLADQFIRVLVQQF